MKRGPTAKQRKAVLDTLENIERAVPKTKEEILLDAGYSPSIAINPQIIENSKGWNELMDEYLPDSLLVQKHKQLLEKMEIKRTFDHSTGEWIDMPTGQVDTQAVKAALELGYKAKKKIGSDVPQGGGNVTVNIVSFHMHDGDNTTAPIQA